MYITGPNHATKSYPTTTINLGVEGRKLSLQMAVNPNINFDGILGTDIPNLLALVPSTGPWNPAGATHHKPRPRRRCRKNINYAVRSSSTDSDNTTPRRITPQPGENQLSSSSSSCDEDSCPPSSEEDTNTPLPEPEPDSRHPQTHSGSDLPDFSDDLFQKVSERNRQTRRQKRLDRQRYAAVWGQPVALDEGSEQLRQAQQEDRALEIIRRKCASSTAPFFGLLYRHWTPPKQVEQVEQLILPIIYRETTLRMAHLAPWAGHFGRRRTTDRVLHRFFWPGVRRDIADMCRRCQTCQKATKGITRKLPLVPLPIIEVPFRRT